MGPDKRRNRHPGLIEEFLENSERQTMPICLYPRKIRRLEYQFPKIKISKDSRLHNTDLWKCTISKR